MSQIPKIPSSEPNVPMLTFSELRQTCTDLRGVVECFPFDLDVMVFKVGSTEKGKMFALMSISSDPVQISLKCDPVRAEALRETFPQITAGYHLSKKHWNTLTLEPNNPLERSLTLELIQHSYDLVVKGMTKAARLEWGI
jgi:predicted DNA-binding protein (MmcQ/YjbR family)